jgi:hypothetical protein
VLAPKKKHKHLGRRLKKEKKNPCMGRKDFPAKKRGM